MRKTNKRKVNKKREIQSKYNDDIIEIKSIKSSKNFENNNKSKKEIKKENKKTRKELIKDKIRKIILKLLFIIIVIIMIFGVWFYNKVQENGGGIRGILITVLGLSVENIESLETINVLLLGISDDIEKELTDTIILCSYNPQKQRASMISMPRDTFIGKNEEVAKGNDKINSLYTKDSPKLLKTVSNMLGIKVDYYAVVKTQVLVDIIDVIGGVNFDVPIDMNYDDPTQNLHIHLRKGMQKIDGEKAEQLLRFRHNNDGSSYPANYGDNDFGRMKTQRKFLLETIVQTIRIKNIFKFKSIVNIIFENIEMNFTLEDLLPYMVTIVDFDLKAIENYQLPGVSKKCNNLWFFVQNKKETEELVKSLEI